MRADVWLTEEISYSERCPQCSQLLKNGSIPCFSCGFSAKSPTGTSVWIDPAVYGLPLSSSRSQSHQTPQEAGRRYVHELSHARRHPNPNTPIPSRSSAQSPDAAPGSVVKPNRIQKNSTYTVEKRRRADYRGAQNVTFESSAHVEARIDSTVEEYETLSSLITDEPTQPELEARDKVTHRLPCMDEITTVSPLNVDHSITSSRALIPVHSQRDVFSFHGSDQTCTNILPYEEVNGTSWTAGKTYKSSHAQLISSRGSHKRPHMAISFNPIDGVRWWLLRPGRIEFVLWLAGTILLVAVTCVLLFVAAFSFEWITPGYFNTASSNTSGTSIGPGHRSTTSATQEMVLIRIDKGPILPGQSIELHGQGFSPLGHISFLFDGTLLLFNQNGQSTSTQANKQGEFASFVVLNNNLPWYPGLHFINAQDLTTKRMVKLPIILSPAPIGKVIPSTPMPTNPPVVTHPALTPIPTVTGAQPTPVGQTPVPITPTPHPISPTPTQTGGTTPTVTPSVGTTPTVTPTLVTTANVTTHGSTLGSGLDNALDHTSGAFFDKQLTHLNPWVWLMVACYCISMVLLGLVGVLHKRHQ